MLRIKKIISAVMAGMTLFSMAPVNAETYTRDTSVATESQSSESFWGQIGQTIKDFFIPEVFAAEDDIASGTSGGVTWVIDAEGTLTLSPTDGVSGQMASLSGYSSGAPWSNYRTKIKKAVAKPGVALGSKCIDLFYQCTNLTEVDLRNLDTSNVTNMGGMFRNCRNLTSLEGLEGWNTSNVTNMNSVFQYCYNLTSLGGLEKWHTNSVTTMISMFDECNSLTSLEPLAGWETSSVTNMSSMFEGCSSLISLEGLAGWETSSVTNMSSMFYGCRSLDSLEPLAGWKTDSVTDMSSMFEGCNGLTSLEPLAEWSTDSVTDMSSMFEGCNGLTSLEPLAGWKTDSVTNMSSMFYGCRSLDSLEPLAGWNTSGVKDMGSMFYGCSGLTSLEPLAEWSTDSVTNMSSMFYGCSSLASLEPLVEWSTDSVTKMSYMFDGCNGLASLEPLAGWNTVNVTLMDWMFYDCNGITSLEPLSNWNISKVTNMSYMFGNCDNLTSLNGLEKWKTNNVIDMSSMFYSCNGLTSLEGLEGWSTGNVTNMYRMFYNCNGLISLEPLAEWSTDSVTNMSSMFYSCNGLTSLEGLEGWYTSNVKTTTSMFRGCNGLISLEPLAEWSTDSAVNMSYMFMDCSSLTSLEPLAGWNTGSITNMSCMFFGCIKTKSADFSNWKIPSSRTNMFFRCSSLSEIAISSEFDFTNTFIPSPEETDEYTGNWAYGDPWNHEETLTGAEFATGTHKAGTWYWERKGESPLKQHYTSNRDNVFVPEYTENPDGSTSLKQTPEEVFSTDGYWQQSDDNTWTYTFYVYDASVQWYVWEEPVTDGYISDATKDNPIIIENGSIVATVTNTLETMPKEFGKMSVQKQLVNETGIAAMEDRSFPFKVTISDENDQQLTGTDVFGGTIFRNGVAYLSVNPNETITVNDIPAGYHYTVEELPDDKYIQEIANDTGVIQPENQSVSLMANDTAGFVVATNTRIAEPERTYGNLTLRKEVTGNVDTEEDFNFIVSFGNLESETTYTYDDQTFTSDYEGGADVEVSLKNGEGVTFSNLPSDAQYRILEEAGNYTSSYTITDANNLGMINQTTDENETTNEELATAAEVLDAGEDVAVTFTNNIMKTQNISISKVVKDAKGQILTDDSRYEFTAEFSNTEPGTEIKSDLGILRTDDNGQVTASFYLTNGDTVEFTDIPVGTQYRFTEAENSATASYKITDTLENQSTVTTKAANDKPKQELSTSMETVDNGEDTQIAFTNTITNGSLTITKKDTDGEPLMGAEFSLTGNDGTVYQSTTTATNSEGVIRWEELPLGTYTLTETKAPAGATLMKEPVTIEITSETPDVEITITDNSAIFLDAGGTGLITWMTISSAALALGTAWILSEKKKPYGMQR